MTHANTLPVSPGPTGDDTYGRLAAALTEAGWAESATAEFDNWRGLYPSNYADPLTQEFPVHTAKAAAASAAAYRLLGGDPSHPVGVRIKEACDAHAVAPVWDRFKVAAVEPTRYCLPAEKKYPVDTAALVKQAASYLESYQAEMPTDTRRTYASNLLAAANAVGGLGEDERHTVELAAGLGRPINSYAIVCRKEAAEAHGQKDIAEVMQKVAEAVAGGRSGYEAAEKIRAIDKMVGWSFNDPTHDLTGMTPTVAKKMAADLVPAASGNMYRRSDLATLPDDLIVAWGLDAALTVEKRASCLKEDVGGAFEAVVQAGGVKPIYVSQPQRVNWKTLAAV